MTIHGTLTVEQELEDGTVIGLHIELTNADFGEAQVGDEVVAIGTITDRFIRREGEEGAPLLDSAPDKALNGMKKLLTGG